MGGTAGLGFEGELFLSELFFLESDENPVNQPCQTHRGDAQVDECQEIAPPGLHKGSGNPQVEKGGDDGHPDLSREPHLRFGARLWPLIGGHSWDEDQTQNDTYDDEYLL